MSVVRFASALLVVALRKESVDRNYLSSFVLASLCVALRKESVDRNAEDWLNAGSLSRSLSARRAWIEMGFVDPDADTLTSLSARRAWIEMLLLFWSIWR